MSAAIGKQLEVLASYRGAQRTVYGLDLSRDYFSMPFTSDDHPETYPGFAFTDDAVVSDYFLQTADVSRPSYSMTDDELLRLTRFLAKTQSRFLSMKEIDEILFEFFGTRVSLVDNGDMTITYHHDPADTDTLFKIVRGVGAFPKPAGVAIIYT